MGVKMAKEIELGDTVKCIYSGFTGVAVCKTVFINGCVQYGLVPKWNKTEKSTPEEAGFDEDSLTIVKRGKRGKEEDEFYSDDADEGYNSGGPMRKPPKRRNF